MLRHVRSETMSYFHQDATSTIKINLSLCHRTSQLCCQYFFFWRPRVTRNSCLGSRSLVVVLSPKKMLIHKFKVSHNSSSVHLTSRLCFLFRRARLETWVTRPYTLVKLPMFFLPRKDMMTAIAFRVLSIFPLKIIIYMT